MGVKVGQRIRYSLNGKVGTVIDRDDTPFRTVRFDDGQTQRLFEGGLKPILSDCPKCREAFEVKGDYLCGDCRKDT